MHLILPDSFVAFQEHLQNSGAVCRCFILHKNTWSHSYWQWNWYLSCIINEECNEAAFSVLELSFATSWCLAKHQQWQELPAASRLEYIVMMTEGINSVNYGGHAPVYLDWRVVSRKDTWSYLLLCRHYSTWLLDASPTLALGMPHLGTCWQALAFLIPTASHFPSTLTLLVHPRYWQESLACSHLLRSPLACCLHNGTGLYLLCFEWLVFGIQIDSLSICRAGCVCKHLCLYSSHWRLPGVHVSHSQWYVTGVAQTSRHEAGCKKRWALYLCEQHYVHSAYNAELEHAFSYQHNLTI